MGVITLGYLGHQFSAAGIQSMTESMGAINNFSLCNL